MRLPFGLGRRSSSGDGAGSVGSGADSSSGGVGAPPASSHAWASLPPIQRTMGAMPLAASPDEFVEGLPGSRGLPPIVQALGHEVSNLANPGLVVARTRAVESSSAAAMPAPVQRRSGRRSPAMSVQTSAATEHLIDEADESGPAPASEAAAMPLPVVQAIRTMPTISRQSVHVPDRPLTTAASAARPAAVQRAAAAAEAAAAGLAPLPAPVSGGMRRVPSGTAPAMPVVSRQANISQPAPATLPVAPAASTSPAAPSRLGLGEPMTSVPASARSLTSAASPVVSRSTTTGPMPVSAAGLLPLAQRTAGGPAADSATAAGLPALASGARGHGAPAGATMPGSASAAGLATAARAAQRLPALPHLPVARQAGSHQSGADGAATPGPGNGSAPTPMPLAPSASDVAHAVQTLAAPEIRPIAAANPLRPSFVLQRTTGDGEDEDAGEQSELPSPWWAPASEARSAGSHAAGTGFDGSPASIQRSASSGSPATVARSFGAPSAFAGAGRPVATMTGVQRSTGASARPMPPARGSAPDPIARSVGVSSSAAPAVVQTGVASTQPGAGSPIGITSGPVVQTSPTDGTGPGATVQRSSVSGPGHVPTVQRLDPPASSAPAKPAAEASGSTARPSEKELEELAQALFSRIRTRLRADLIHDREAKGLTFDNV